MCKQYAFELPHRERMECPDCLERSLTLSTAEITLDDGHSVGMVYEARCLSCGFSVQRDESYGVPLAPVLNALVMLDVRRTQM